MDIAARNIPEGSGPKPVEWIQSDGNAWICISTISEYDSSADSYEITFQYKSNGTYQSVNGCRTVKNVGDWCITSGVNIMHYSVDKNLADHQTNFGNHQDVPLCIISKPSQVVFKKAGIASTYDIIKSGNTFSFSRIGGYPLFGRIDSTSPTLSFISTEVKIGGFKYWKADALVFDGIAVKFTNVDGEDEGAFYDSVSKQLFKNAGSGKFIIGPTAKSK